MWSRRNKNKKDRKNPMFGRAYGDARTPNWLHRHLTPLPGIASMGLRRNKGETLWGRQPFCPHFSSTTGVCGWCDCTLPLFRILGLTSILAASGVSEWDQPGSSSSFSVAGLLMTNTEEGGDEIQHWVLGGGGHGPPLPLPHYLQLAAHCHSDKSSHLVPSLGRFSA